MSPSVAAPATILLLYVCQGLVSGTLSILPTLLVDADSRVPTAVLGVLGLPMYAFTLKFLWAPVVDRFAIISRRMHQRAQYAVATQVVLSLTFFSLVAMWYHAGKTDEAFLWSICGSAESAARATGTKEGGRCVSAWDSSPLLHTALLFALALSSATQDVAVDAWAVECLGESGSDHSDGGEDSSLAGILQMLGLVGGSSATQLFLLFRDPASATAHLGLYFAICGTVCALACASACLLPFLLRGSGAAPVVPDLRIDDSSRAGDAGGVLSIVWNTLASIVRDGPSRRFVSILLTRGWPSAAVAVLTQLLQTSGVVDAPFLARVRVLTTVVAVATAMLLSSRVVNKWGSATLFRWNSGFDFASAVVSVCLFASLFGVGLARNHEPSGELEWSTDGYLRVVVVMSLASAAVGAVSFVSVVDMSARLARKFHAQHAATAITVFNAMANLGYTLPNSVVLFAFDPLVARFSPSGVDSSDPVTRRWVLVWIVAPSIFVIAFVARLLLLVPSSVALVRESRQEISSVTPTAGHSRKHE